MSSIQYTVRNVPSDVDFALRQRAKKSKQSFNATIIKALSEVTGQRKDRAKNDIDWFYGSGGIGSAELKAFSEQRTVDHDAWKNS